MLDYINHYYQEICVNSMLRAAWLYRFFIVTSIKTELRTRFVRSRLGGFWMILNPLAQVFLFAFVLSAVMSAKLPGINNRYAYAIYLMAGTLGWSLFVEIVNKCVMVFVDNANILKKLVFPKIALPLIVTGSALINNILLFLAILVIFGALGHSPGVAIVWLPLLMILTIAGAVGVGLILGVLNVFIRDIGHMVPVLLQFLFWFTPIAYMVNIIPQQYRGWLMFNPLIPIITAYQDVLLYNRSPNWVELSEVAVVAIILLAFSLFLFRKASPEMVDQL